MICGLSVPVRNILLDEEIVSLPPVISAKDYLEFLEGEQLFLLHHTGSPSDKLYKMSTILRRLAKDLKVLIPPNDCILGPGFDISRFDCKKRMLDELWRELRQALCRCSPEVSSSGVFVCTSTPYAPYLVTMADEMVSGIPPSAWITKDEMLACLWANVLVNEFHSSHFMLNGWKLTLRRRNQCIICGFE